MENKVCSESLQNIKKIFFAYRNGIIADTLRKAGMPYKVIFGLQVPQLASIARTSLSEIESMSARIELAYSLWNDAEVRESRLLAAYIFNPEQTSLEEALDIAKEIKTREEADMLAFRLFKRLLCSSELLEAMESDPHLSMACEALRAHLF